MHEIKLLSLLSLYTSIIKKLKAVAEKPLREKKDSFCTVSAPSQLLFFILVPFCSATNWRTVITRVRCVGRSIYGQALSGKINSFNEKQHTRKKLEMQFGQRMAGTQMEHTFQIPAPAEAFHQHLHQCGYRDIY